MGAVRGGEFATSPLASGGPLVRLRQPPAEYPSRGIISGHDDARPDRTNEVGVWDVGRGTPGPSYRSARGTRSGPEVTVVQMGKRCVSRELILSPPGPEAPTQGSSAWRTEAGSLSAAASNSRQGGVISDSLGEGNRSARSIREGCDGRRGQVKSPPRRPFPHSPT